MNLAQQIGQLVVVGFDGYEVNEHISTLITKYHVGNIILFEKNCKNPNQVFKLVQDLQKLAIESNGVPLFVTIDQENGMVARISEGVTLFPGNMAQAAGATLEEVYQVGRYTGEGLKALGINFNLAPSVDINNNPHNPVIGVRSYGETGEQVASFASHYIKGLQDAGVISTAKHFPGHGDTSVDSHLDLPVVAHDKVRLEEVELYPFKVAIDEGIQAIMSAHVKFPAYEPDGLPATLSYRVLTGLLRERLGFKGLVITDCMEMKAIDTYYGTSKAVPLAIKAGADLVCISHSKDKQIEAIAEVFKSVEEGTISFKRIDESVERILSLKEHLNVEAFLGETYEQAKAKLYQEQHQTLARKISRGSITLVKNNGIIPVKAMDILVVAPYPKVLTGADAIKKQIHFGEYFKEAARDRAVTSYVMSYAPSDEEITEVTMLARGRETVILCTYNGMLSPNQMKMAKSILSVNPNVILIPMRNPYDYVLLEEVAACLLPYEYTKLSMASLVSVLLGNKQAEGKLPIILKM